MDWFVFLDTMENTLEQVEVHGKNNIDCMLGCFIAIQDARNYLIRMQRKEAESDKAEINVLPKDKDGNE